MKKTIKYTGALLTLVAALLFLGSCEDMLGTDSSRIAFEDDNQLKSPNDSIYSVLGILSQLQKVGDRYVLLGELRGDLMTVSDEAPLSLKEINNFELTSENTYLDKRSYYTVINNCNYAITRMDTAINIRNEKVMLPEFAAIKAIRAWTYFQLAQIYGSVSYITEPILDYETALKEYPTIGMDDLITKLITDLLPYTHVRSLDYGYIDDQLSSKFFIPIPMLLGDFYLYQNRFQEAAGMYYQLMADRKYTITTQFANSWKESTRENVLANHSLSYRDEIITNLAYSIKPKDYHPNLINISYNNVPSILPVSNFVDEMTLKTHFFASKYDGMITAYLEGDLRGRINFASNLASIGDAFQTVNISGVGQKTIINKYLTAGKPDYTMPVEKNGLLTNAYIQTSIPIYRQPHLYLRFAEAVNRAGKPTLAFAVLKYGLIEENIINPIKVNPSELTGGESYLDFSFTEDNVGTACRGLGMGISKDVTSFIIPNFTQADKTAARQDSIDWVELKILEEMTAETAYEGNRFFDLLRISRHRANHPAFMAEKVSVKYKNSEAMKTKLMDINAWFLK